MGGGGFPEPTTKIKGDSRSTTRNSGQDHLSQSYSNLQLNVHGVLKESCIGEGGRWTVVKFFFMSVSSAPAVQHRCGVTGTACLYDFDMCSTA
jgi:hypothetical protein